MSTPDQSIECANPNCGWCLNAAREKAEEAAVVRVTAEERSLIWAAADADHQSVSGWVRECALVRAESALSAPQSAQNRSGRGLDAGGVA
jgi:hypothetical protein